MTDQATQISTKPAASPATWRVGYAVGAFALVVYCAFIALTFFLTGGWLITQVRDHYVFFVGLPAAALVSFVIVSVIETVRGDIEFEGSGFKFKGASGPIIMWVFVYLAIVASFALVWPLG